jgi:transcriptional regulator with XRE-family HTH domain
MQPLGPKIRKQRRRLGLTLGELSTRVGISKPYLSLIETGRIANPPRDEKLRRLEQVLGFPDGELLTQAHLQKTPEDVRALLESLLELKYVGANAGRGPSDLSSELREFVTKKQSAPAAVTVLKGDLIP